MPLADGRCDTKLGRVADLVWLQCTDRTSQILGRYLAGYKHGVRERPAFVSGIKLGNLRVCRFNVGTADQPAENVSKYIHAGMRDKITADRPWVIVAVEKLRDRDDLTKKIRP